MHTVSNTNRQDLADRQAVVDQARRNHSVDATHHIMATIDVDVDGDQATARANTIATFVPSAGRPRGFLIPASATAFGLSARRDGWRLSRVEVSPVWEADLRA
jgi:SnoaL-like domain